MSASIGFVLGFADFSTSLPRAQVAEVLSTRLFGGIPFVEKDIDEDYQLGRLCLAQDFLGLHVDRRGGDGGYSLELGILPSASAEPGVGEVGDLSPMLKQGIRKIAEFALDAT